MDKESLYWALSTLAQVSAALVAFIGFFVLNAISEVAKAAGEIAEDAKEFVIRYGHTQGGTSRLSLLSESEIVALSDRKFMAYAAETQGSIGTVNIGAQLKAWTPLDGKIREAQRVLIVFIGWNLTIICLSVSGVPLVPILVDCPGLPAAFFIGVVSVVLTAGAALYKAYSY